MPDPKSIFAINTYSYTFSHTASDCVRHLADQGYRGVELMMFPGHLWPSEVDASGLRKLRQDAEAGGLRIVSLNMPNIDLNITGASPEMREYSLGLLKQFVRIAGDLGAPAIIIGPGKANPLFPAPKTMLMGYFYTALDILAPIAEASGTALIVENMPFAFLPDADSLMQALDSYGNDKVGVIYDVANGHFIGENPRDGLRRVQSRLKLVHFSDTGTRVYKHDPIGHGDVPFANIPPVLAEVGYKEMPVLEIISHDPDADTLDSAQKLAAAGYA
jgi:L-ribulose-5-phosphate 3-epimerase